MYVITKIQAFCMPEYITVCQPGMIAIGTLEVFKLAVIVRTAFRTGFFLHIDLTIVQLTVQFRICHHSIT